jgi:Rieske 2Fe-2S family protein
MGRPTKPETETTRVGLQKSLPGPFYTSDEFFANERDHIFFREWFCVGRVHELPAPGDFLLFDAFGESVILVRAQDGELRAFYNVCRHRGCQLVLEAPIGSQAKLGPTGRFKGAIRCPYHAWTYALDGTLSVAPFLGEGVERDQFSLHSIDVSSWGGFVFLRLTRPDAKMGENPLTAQLGDIPERTARYPLSELQTGRRLTYDVQANWKVLIENYNECYHCGNVHPELCEVMPALKMGGGASLDWSGGIPHREGAYTFTRSGTSTREPFPALSPTERMTHKAAPIYPNLLINLSSEHVAAFILWPMSPDRTIVFCDLLFHPDEMAKSDFDSSDAADFYDLVNRQDWQVCEGAQRGMHSRVFTHGYYAPMEEGCIDIREYVRERIPSNLTSPR